jgi:hypothetical protein
VLGVLLFVRAIQRDSAPTDAPAVNAPPWEQTAPMPEHRIEAVARASAPATNSAQRSPLSLGELVLGVMLGIWCFALSAAVLAASALAAIVLLTQD